MQEIIAIDKILQFDLVLFQALCFGFFVSILTVWKQAAKIAGNSMGKDLAWTAMILACAGLSAGKFLAALAPEVSASLETLFHSLRPTILPMGHSSGELASFVATTAGALCCIPLGRTYCMKRMEIDSYPSTVMGIVCAVGLIGFSALQTSDCSDYAGLCAGGVLLLVGVGLLQRSNTLALEKIHLMGSFLAAGGALIWMGALNSNEYIQAFGTLVLICGGLIILHLRINQISQWKMSEFNVKMELTHLGSALLAFWTLALMGAAGGLGSGKLFTMTGVVVSMVLMWARFRHMHTSLASFVESRGAEKVVELLGGVSAAAFLLDQSGLVESVSGAALEFSGMNAEQLSGKNLREIFSMWDSWPVNKNWTHWQSRDEGGNGQRLLVFERKFVADGKSVVTVFDITSESDTREAFEKLAKTDPLTGLPNRREAMDRLAVRCQNPEHQFVVCFADLDNFKNANDTEGHWVGDQLLQDLAVHFESVVHRVGGWVARLGGDEFLFCLPNGTGEMEAQSLAKRLLRDMESLESTRRFSIGVSMGASVFPIDGLDPGELIKHADAALYSAKEKGRGRIVIYGSHLETVLRQRVEIEAVLRRCLTENKGLSLYCQPLVRLSDYTLSGCECLLRFDEPVLSLAGTFNVVRAAELSGLIVPLGRWVLDSALALADALRENQIHLTVSLNVSTRQFSDEFIWSQLANWAQKNGGAEGRIKLEVTESAVADDFERARDLLEGCLAGGFGIALDDFGTGYSSLSTLRTLPFTQMKIDKSLMDDIGKSVAAEKVALAALSLAQALDIEVVAEGIERQEQAQWLRRNGGVVYGQGYLWSHPIPYPDFLELAKSGIGLGPQQGHDLKSVGALQKADEFSNLPALFKQIADKEEQTVDFWLVAEVEPTSTGFEPSDIERDLMGPDELGTQ